MVYSLKVVYYCLYSLDAVMCLLVIPFAYFWYEEWDLEVTTKQRLKGALKYSSFFVALMVVLLLVGLFVPVAKEMKGHLDLDYFKKLLMENSRHLPPWSAVVNYLGGIEIAKPSCRW